jgi:hypothetical protein
MLRNLFIELRMGHTLCSDLVDGRSIQLAEDHAHWWALVLAVLNLGSAIKAYVMFIHILGLVPVI